MGNYRKDNMEEKYYTPDYMVEELFNLKDKYVDFEISEYLENSAGGGSIVDKFDKPYKAYDIINETGREDIIECDYLKEKIEYKKGRVTIMNPPFNKGLKFLYKSLKEGDYTIALLSQNSLLNMDYSKVWVEEIQLWKKVTFGSACVNIILVACRNKKEDDRYEYE